MIYKYLAKHKKKVNIHATDEYRFYIKHAATYARTLSLYKYGIAETQPFKIISANIIIKAMLNKDLIESKLSEFELEATQHLEYSKDLYIKNKVWELLEENNAPYFQVEKSRVYIPIFSRTLNLIYNEECSKILGFPYNNLMERPKTSCIDLFDVYNIDLFASPFTSLILIKKDKTSAAFYHADFETIYIINNQGRLDCEIPLYDRSVKNLDQHRIISKIQEVVDAYYSNDLFKFVKSLYDNHFISKKLYLKIKTKIAMSYLWKDKMYRKGKESHEVL